MYCGDETGSFVGEVGSHTSRFGYGGDDAPKFVVPSLCLPPPPTTSSITATVQQEGSEFTPESRRRKKHTTLRLQRAASCYRWRAYGGADGDTDNDDAGDYRTPLRRARQTPESGAASTLQPIVDPNRFLSQGEAIDDWDAYASLWESAMDSLHVRDPSKHTSIGTKSIRAHPTEHNAPGHSSTNLSTATGRSSQHQHEAGLAHPMLVIRPGFTHLYGSRGDNNDQPPSEATAMEVDDSDTKLQEMSTDPKADTDLHQQRNHHRAEMEKLVELFMEDFGARAVFVAPAPMLAAFSHGRQTALVVDVGASGWCVLHLSRVAA
jgi:Actin